MNEISLHDLKEGCVQLSQLASYFQIPVMRLSAGVVRKASRTLVLSETLFSKNLVLQAKEWQRVKTALDALQNRSTVIDSLQNSLQENQKKKKILDEALEAWNRLESVHRQNFKAFHKRCEDVQSAPFSMEDELFIKKFQRYQLLKPLFSIVHNPTLIQEQIKNYDNRDKIRSNVESARDQLADVAEKLKSVTRGLYVTLILSLLVVTIPLTIPFIISLWTRKKQIQIQILNLEEGLERDECRLRSAEEGETVSKQMKEKLGNIDSNEFREFLNEINEVKDLFLNYDVIKKGGLISVLMFLDHHQKDLESVFGEAPIDPVEQMQWLSINLRDIERQEVLLHEAEKEIERISAEINTMMKGHNDEILRQSIARLKDRKNSVLDLPMDDEFKAQFSHLCQVVPEILEEVKVTLEQLEKGTNVSETAWGDLGRRLSSISNLISACLFTLELPGYEAVQGG